MLGMSLVPNGMPGSGGGESAMDRRNRALSESGRALMSQMGGLVGAGGGGGVRTFVRVGGGSMGGGNVGGLKGGENGLHSHANDSAMDSQGNKESASTKPKIRWSSEEHRATMRQAVEAVLINGNTTKVAERFNIPARTLRRYVAKEKRRRETGSGPSLFTSKKSSLKSKAGKKSKAKKKKSTKSSATKPVNIAENGRDRTASVDFVMKHINAADPASFADFFGKDLIMSFGEAASSGRLRTLSSESFGGRLRGASVERFLAEKMHSVAPIDIHNDEHTMDMDGFDMPTLMEDGDISKGLAGRGRKVGRKRDRNMSLDLLGLQNEPTTQKTLLSSSPWVAKSPGMSSLLATSPSVFKKNLEELMRHRASTANSLSNFPAEFDGISDGLGGGDVDITGASGSGGGGGGSMPDFFVFEK